MIYPKAYSIYLSGTIIPKPYTLSPKPYIPYTPYSFPIQGDYRAGVGKKRVGIGLFVELRGCRNPKPGIGSVGF